MTSRQQPSFTNLSEHSKIRFVCLAFLLLAPAANAGPFVVPGDPGLRHDIRLLADSNIVTGPVSNWPLAWGPILDDLSRVDESKLSQNVGDALYRVRARGRWETRVDEIHYNAKASVAEKPNRIRSFENGPRERAELSLGVSWTGDFLSADLNAQAVASPDDGEEFRYDNSALSVLLGNYAITVNTLDRWWGPGWDGSLILSSNARPIPAITLERNFTDAFENRWLAWLGPWDFSVQFGQMERERVVPNALFFGFRFDVRPLPSLEVGLSRTAQWCGDNRPCGSDTFADLLFGRDNRGDAGIGTDNEPGNQLAGIDFRWNLAGFGLPVAVYGQFTGEDEAGGFPSRYLALGGIDAHGMLGSRWSYRWFGEGVYSKCNFYQSDEGFNCAYNHSIYRSGYRYRGRSIGHAADNDALMFSTGLLLIDRNDTQWQGLFRYGELNRGGAPDSSNSLTPTQQTVISLDLMHSRAFRFGELEFGAGIEQLEDNVGGTSDQSGRAYLQWRSAY
jgi:hypothetical protein